MQVNKTIYLDYAASAPLCKVARDLLKKYYIDTCEFQANPNSVHNAGRTAFNLLEDARKEMAFLLGANRPSEIVFCSGATEANNAALFGIGNLTDYSKLHLIISNIEHPSVIKAAEALKILGAKLDYISVDSNGQLIKENLRRALEKSKQDKFKLVSIQYVNSEIGAIQDISNLVKIVKSFPNAYFHCDATQALGKIIFNLQELGVDSASFSAHKIGACKSSGSMYIKHTIPFKPLLNGGGQEGAKRSGTQDAISAYIFAKVFKDKCSTLKQDVKTCQELRDQLVLNIDKSKLKINLYGNNFVPNIINIQLFSLENHTALLRLSEKGIYVSAGSACSSSSIEPSRTLKAIGLSTHQANSSIRVSFCAETSKKDIDLLIEGLNSIL